MEQIEVIHVVMFKFFFIVKQFLLYITQLLQFIKILSNKLGKNLYLRFINVSKRLVGFGVFDISTSHI